MFAPDIDRGIEPECAAHIFDAGFSFQAGLIFGAAYPPDYALSDFNIEVPAKTLGDQRALVKSSFALS